MKKNWNIIQLMILTLSIFSCQNETFSSGSTDSNDSGPPTVEDQPLSEEELKEELQNKECNEVAKYISGTLSYGARYKSLLSMKADGIKLTLNMTSSATLATFKDIHVKVTFTSKTGAVVVEEKITVPEFIKPGESIKYDTEIDCTEQNYMDIVAGSWVIVDASCN